MYEELVRLLKDKAERFDYDGWVDTAAVMEKAADAIEKLIEVIQNHDFLESLIKPRWIPVTEGLPKKPKNYPHCELRECYFLVALESTAVVSCAYDFENNRWRESFKVTHWMPLPEPPKEEANHDAG